MNPVANPSSVLAFVTAFEALPLLSAITDAAIQSLANQSYNQGLTDQAAADSAASGTVTVAQEQTDIAAAVASAVAPLNTQITSLQLSVSQEQALLASVQTAVQSLLATLTAAPASS